MELEILTFQFKTKEPITTAKAPKLRGFFATKFKKKIFHQHSGNNFIFQYPRIQYKILDNTPTIIAFEEGLKEITKIFHSLKEITLGNKVFTIIEKYLNITNHKIGISTEMQEYKFTTPWFALNQKNYILYSSLISNSERKEFLSRILTGNILSMCKSIGLKINKKIQCETKVYAKTSSMKTVKIMPFVGYFKTNFEIPELFGLGKSVSRGFGTVKKVKKLNATSFEC